MRKNKALLKRAASLFNCFGYVGRIGNLCTRRTDIAGSTKSGNVVRIISELSEELVNGTDPENI